MKKKLKKIPEGTISRGFAFGKLAFQVTQKTATFAASKVFGSSVDEDDRIKDLLQSQMELITKEFGKLKGTAMKVGQTLSMYGEHFLPPQANAFLKTLQSQSQPLEWNAVSKHLSKQLGKEVLEQLEIDPEPFAAASIGQVHRAKISKTGEEIVLKIQYPGIEDAIEGDLKLVKSIFQFTKMIPKGPNIDELFKEIRQMLHQEMDYQKELEWLKFFREKLSGIDDVEKYLIPKPHEEFSSKRVLATSFVEGIALDDPAVLALPQSERNEIGKRFLDLYLRELFEFQAVQTDPHFGNFKIVLNSDKTKVKQIVLFDYGAVRKVPKKFLVPYSTLIRSILNQDRPMAFDSATELGFLMPEDSNVIKESFFDLTSLLLESCLSDLAKLGKSKFLKSDFFLEDGSYLWGKSDLPQRVAEAGGPYVLVTRLRPPPRESVFLDRKMGGMFVILSKLSCQINPRPLLESALTVYSERNS